jgi:Spy/CpxP family protein refolding chaperone
MYVFAETMKLRTVTIAIAAITVLLVGLISVVRAQDEESRKHFLHTLGGPFFVSRDKVQEDLRISDDQKHKLRETMTGYVQKTMQVQKLNGAEREQAMRSLRQESYGQLEVFLKEILKPEQCKRFEQLKLQYDVPSVFLEPRVGDELKITAEQRKQFMGAIQEMQKAVGPLMKEAKSCGGQQETARKVIKLRRDCEGKIKNFMTDAQRRQWEEMTGARLDIW